MVYFVKFKYFRTTTDQEPHKIQKYEVQNESFAELISLLPLNDGPFMIRYEDTDGDLCTIDNDSTLKVALKGLSSSSTLVLRVDYKPTTSSHGIKKENQTKSCKKPARRSARIDNVKKEIKIRENESVDGFKRVQLARYISFQFIFSLNNIWRRSSCFQLCGGVCTLYRSALSAACHPWRPKIYTHNGGMIIIYDPRRVIQTPWTSLYSIKSLSRKYERK